MYFVWISSLFFVAEWYSPLWIYHNPFIYSTTDGLLWHFLFVFFLMWLKLLWTLSTSLQVDKSSFLLGKYLGMKLLAQMAIVHLTLYENAKPFSKVVVPFYKLISIVWGFSCFAVTLALLKISWPYLCGLFLDFLFCSIDNCLYLYYQHTVLITVAL